MAGLITDLTNMNGAASIDRATDLMEIVDLSGNVSYKATPNFILGFTGGNPVSTSDTQTLTNKFIGITNTVTASDALFTLQDDGDNTKQAKFQLSGITTATTRTYTLPNSSSTLVDLITTQVLTNKTLTSPTINTATIVNPTLTVDAVTGFSDADTGTVYGITVTNGVLQGSTILADGIVLPKNLQTGTGSTWAWTTWSPTLTNLTGGTQTYAKYLQVGKTVYCRFKYTLAGAGVGGAVSFTLPVTASADYATSGEFFMGNVALIDAGVNFYAGLVLWNTSTSVKIRRQSGTTIDDVSSTVPFTWGSGDFIQAHFMYEAA